MIFLDFSTLNTMLPPYGEGWGGAPVFGHNSILYDPKLNALLLTTHSFTNYFPILLKLLLIAK